MSVRIFPGYFLKRLDKNILLFVDKKCTRQVKIYLSCGQERDEDYNRSDLSDVPVDKRVRKIKVKVTINYK
jgi:hypothetical protein